MKSLAQIERDSRALMDDLKLYLGRDVIIPCGVFKGRVGKITAITLTHGFVTAMCQPYRLAGGPREDLLWDHSDARTYWNITEDDFVKGERRGE